MKHSKSVVSVTALTVGSLAVLTLAGCSTSSSGSSSSSASPSTNSSASNSTGASDSGAAPNAAAAKAAADPLAVETFGACQDFLSNDNNLNGTIKWPAITAMNPRPQAGGWVFNGTVTTTKQEKLTFTCGLKKVDGEWIVIVQKRSYSGNADKPDNV